MGSNEIQGGNGEYNQYKLKHVSEPTTSTRENSGDIKVATIITDPGKGKYTNNIDNSNEQEEKGI